MTPGLDDGFHEISKDKLVNERLKKEAVIDKRRMKVRAETSLAQGSVILTIDVARSSQEFIENIDNAPTLTEDE